jgi:hypothetical protein
MASPRPAISATLARKHPVVETASSFRSFFMAGFECSTHKLADGRRLDVIAATRHDVFAHEDYERLRKLDLRVAREGVRWHLVETEPGRYNFSSVEPIVAAAEATGTQVIWDLCHFGWPDHLDIMTPEFVSGLGAFANAFAAWLLSHERLDDYFVPVNEISFFSWGGGHAGVFKPFLQGHGCELKQQLVRAWITALASIMKVMPRARFVNTDPIIHVAAHPDHPEDKQEAESYRLSQYDAWDMLVGRARPELGGQESFLDVMGVNFYPHNEWYYNLRAGKPVRPFAAILPGDPDFRPFNSMLKDVYARYSRPILIAETGTEGNARVSWFRYLCLETLQAIQAGVPVLGLCLYPIVNHPGWGDNRHCYNGLWDYADEQGGREIYEPLARELERFQPYFRRAHERRLNGKELEALAREVHLDPAEGLVPPEPMPMPRSPVEFS